MDRAPQEHEHHEHQPHADVAAPTQGRHAVRSGPTTAGGRRSGGRRDLDVLDCGHLTLGVEEEILLVDPATSALAPVGPQLVAAAPGDPRFTLELRAAQIEAVSPVCLTVADVERELASARTALGVLAAGVARPVAVAASPATTDPGPASPGERHRSILAQAPWAQAELLTCGMHVHVGVAGADRIVALHDALRSYLPLLSALGANSPFHGGLDRGVASVRARLKGTLARSGVPPAFGSWRRYEDFLRWGAAGPVIPNATYHWYDLRISPTFPTLEIRVFDVQTDVSHAAGLVALVQALCSRLLERIDEGDRVPVHAEARLSEALWLAARDGAAGALPDPATGRLVPVDAALAELLDELDGHIAALGSRDHVEHLWDLQRLPGHERQRIVHRSNGIDGLVDWLAVETLGPGRQPLARSGAGETPGPVAY